MKLLGGVETGNESGIGFEDDLSSTNFFLGRIKFGGRWTSFMRVKSKKNRPLNILQLKILKTLFS